VLNALRHQRFLHPITVDDTARSAASCSTPYGIKGFCTSAETDIFTLSDGAQRLTASKVFALRVGVVIAQAKRCSTPYGIKGFCTPGVCPLSAAPWGKCSTPYGIKGFCTEEMGITTTTDPPRAQRLTASKVFALCKESQVREVGPGAQRLTASKVFAPDDGRHCQAAAFVLNALRHQRFLHPRAFQVVLIPPTQCSTPYGIKGFCTNKTTTRKTASGPVLNALRHQRFLHGVKQSDRPTVP